MSRPADRDALRFSPAAWTGPAGPCRSPDLGSGGDPMSVLDTATLNEVRSIIGQGRLDDLLHLFAEELNARPRAVRDALADHAFARAAAETHSLKGAAANLGADAVAEAARLLEQAISAANGGDRSGVAPSLRRLAAAVSDTQHALAALPRARAPVPLSA